MDALTRYLAAATDLSTSDRRLLEGRLATMQRQIAATATTTTTTTTTTTDPVVSDPEPVDEGVSTETLPPDDHDEVAPPPAPSSGGIGIVPGAVVVGIGGAALVGAAIAGGVAMSVQADRDGACNLPGGACPGSLDQNDYASRFGAARDAAWGLFIVGAATAVVGAVLLGVGASDHADQPTITAACDATGCTGLVSGHF